ncbi:MAG: FAD-binding oxidoreductase [Enterobacterales bacterium]|nr:FAD-binding oxidoreductase [Enterobacterales bacterium]
MSNDFYCLTISHCEKLTKDSLLVSFDLPTELQSKFNYQQGQHLTLKMIIDGEEMRRSYSICNGVNRQQLQIAIKAIDQGVFSNYALQNFHAGMSIDIMPPQGHFYSELKSNASKNYCLIAVGSGITPILSHLESILSSEPNSRVTLLFGNRRSAEMMFRDQINFIKNEHLARFQWLNFFTQEENDAVLLNGRISPQKIIDLNDKKLMAIEHIDEVFICGPEALTLDLAKAFEFWKVSPHNIHYELFFSAASEKKSVKKQKERAQKYGEKVSQVTLKIAGRKTKMPIEMGGKNILDAAIEQGADLPFSCKAGVCATCKAKVISGKVDMDTNHSLTEPEIVAGMILTCQSHPASESVEIDFDFS